MLRGLSGWPTVGESRLAWDRRTMFPSMATYRPGTDG